MDQVLIINSCQISIFWAPFNLATVKQVKALLYGTSDYLPCTETTL